MYAHYQVLPSKKCTFILLCTTLNLKACKINKTSGALAESKKVRDISKRGEGFPENRPFDASRGQNRYVTLPLKLVELQRLVAKCCNIRKVI